ncbi:MAG: aspartyl/asparaginyl beta-hydroxylase domain-containing protein [Acidimicrobiales bacterium]
MLDQFSRVGAFECFVSRLAPGTHLVPHCRTNNLVLTIHLPLVIPEGDCAIRVSDDTRGWEPGQVEVFDDSFEHEAWNHTDADRLVLLVSFLHPDLTEVECQAISQVMPVWSRAYEDLLAAGRDG